LPEENLMSERSAKDSIKGYLYQFDYTILQILSATPGQTIVVEGIEDVDVNSATEFTAIQCKYYSNSEYNHSIIKEPIQLMLRHFKQCKVNNTQLYSYKLRGSYASGTGETHFTC
jgi:predicted helicase